MPKKNAKTKISSDSAKSQKLRAKSPQHGNLRTYTILDYRLEKPRFTLRQVRVGGEVRYEVESGDLSAPAPPIRESKYLRREQCIEIYRWMLLNRRMETALENLYKQGQVVGGVYFGLGQEACSCASAYALQKEEWLGPMIRNQGALLVRGFPPADIMMQYMAKSGSPTRGRDASSHFGDIEKRNVVSPISTLGDLIPVLAGVALGARLQGKHIAVMTYIGDGGQSTGVTYEGLNFAAVQNLGLVLIVENNLWGYSTPADMQFRVKDLAERAIAYGIPGVIVDGTDACQVYDACHEACERARRGDGPTLIEAKMMRMKGHAIHDAAEYVPEPLFEYWKRRDPIARLEDYLVNGRKWLSPAENEKLIGDVERQLEADRELAVNSPLPTPESAAGGVYCEDGCHGIKPKYAMPESRTIGERGGRSSGAKRSEAAVHLK
ncbi:MAG TPA: thiamine pyrophosphate-dependent dehydrogenase E1 component subunit alpha [Candidatus Acidoferrales bacterium]|nr:thiamine pyrophosphate-dependent dehydrogenase E1 component subunit alpha [Candidatus Acidoferrales bacterium]